MCATGVARAEDAPPLEDVTLRGRILRPDGTPLSNAAIYVDAVDPGGFLDSGGTTRHRDTTDAKGAYSFTFDDAHRRGQQSNTDYFLHAEMPSQADAGGSVTASYELELQDAVHRAPDLVMWDPQVQVVARADNYAVTFDGRPSLTTHVSVLEGDRRIGTYDDGIIDPLDIEDTPVDIVPGAYVDVAAAGTIYHQRFSAIHVRVRGSLVPLSRGAACTATRRDQTTTPCSELTDGNLTRPPSFGRAGKSQVDHVTIDLGAVQPVGEVRDRRCTCNRSVSVDGVTWTSVSRLRPSIQPARYVRLTPASVDELAELSVWPPEAALAAPSIALLPRPTPKARSGHEETGSSWPLGLGGLAILVAAAGFWISRARRR